MLRLLLLSLCQGGLLLSDLLVLCSNETVAAFHGNSRYGVTCDFLEFSPPGGAISCVENSWDDPSTVGSIVRSFSDPEQRARLFTMPLVSVCCSQWQKKVHWMPRSLSYCRARWHCFRRHTALYPWSAFVPRPLSDFDE